MTLDELLAALGDVRCVFWACHDHETEHVEWDRVDGKMVPRCVQCGKTGAPQ